MLWRLRLHHLTDASGKPDAVVLPRADWLELKEYCRQLQGRELVLAECANYPKS